ncbi:MAG: hypothetical protein ACTSWY_10335 [Promethearchaeota archaeon]
MLIIDTCSWLKIQELEEKKVLNIKILIYESDLWATHELIKEYHHFLDNYLDFKKFSILSIEIDKLKGFIEEDLDDADLSIIEFGRENPDTIIITDDGPELTVSSLYNLKSFQLSEFLLFLLKNDILKKNEAIRSIKKLLSWKNIKKKKKKKLLKLINLTR